MCRQKQYKGNHKKGQDRRTYCGDTSPMTRSVRIMTTGQGHGRLVVGLLHGAMVGGVMVGLMCNGLVWWDLHTVLRWQGFRAVGWGCGGACVWRVSTMAGLVCCIGVVPWQGFCRVGWC